MNFVACGEDCRYQIDGYCTRSDLTCTGGVSVSKCRYFEKK